MRILRLDFGPDIGSADLHPFISVVHGLDEARASRLMSAIRSLVSGTGHGLAGLVEHVDHHRLAAEPDAAQVDGDVSCPIGLAVALLLGFGEQRLDLAGPDRAGVDRGVGGSLEGSEVAVAASVACGERAGVERV